MRPIFVLALAIAACSEHAPAATRDAPVASVSAPVAIGPCRDGDPLAQRHGSTCLCCHSDEFGVGGSVDRDEKRVARIVIVDAVGDVADLAPNRFENFFRHFPMVPPMRAIAYGPDGRASPMIGSAPTGDCNRCHGGTAAPIHGP